MNIQVIVDPLANYLIRTFEIYERFFFVHSFVMVLNGYKKKWVREWEREKHKIGKLKSLESKLN
jgi:hypothetical protein